MANDAGLAEFFAETIELCRENLHQALAYIGILTVMSVIADMAAREPGLVADLSSEMLLVGGIALAVVFLIVWTAFGYLLTVSMLASRGEFLRSGSRFWPFVGLMIVSGIGVVLGLMLLIVPGLIALTRWIAASGYVLSRGKGILDSMSASSDLTQGKGWHIFGGLLLVYGGGTVISGVFDNAASGATYWIAILLSACSSLISNVVGVFGIAFGIAIFCLLDRNEDQTAAVFA